jgi:Spy/CpxP family protein refolding chaperone
MIRRSIWLFTLLTSVVFTTALAWSQNSPVATPPATQPASPPARLSRLEHEVMIRELKLGDGQAAALRKLYADYAASLQAVTERGTRIAAVQQELLQAIASRDEKSVDKANQDTIALLIQRHDLRVKYDADKLALLTADQIALWKDEQLAQSYITGCRWLDLSELQCKQIRDLCRDKGAQLDQLEKDMNAELANLPDPDDFKDPGVQMIRKKYGKQMQNMRTEIGKLLPYRVLTNQQVELQETIIKLPQDTQVELMNPGYKLYNDLTRTRYNTLRLEEDQLSDIRDLCFEAGLAIRRQELGKDDPAVKEIQDKVRQQIERNILTAEQRGKLK